jgi:hypothetical protein
LVVSRVKRTSWAPGFPGSTIPPVVPPEDELLDEPEELLDELLDELELELELEVDPPEVEPPLELPPVVVPLLLEPAVEPPVVPVPLEAAGEQAVSASPPIAMVAAANLRSRRSPPRAKSLMLESPFHSVAFERLGFVPGSVKLRLGAADSGSDVNVVRLPPRVHRCALL